MKKLTYIGKQEHRSTIRVEKDGKKVEQELVLIPGEDTDLQEDHPVIKSLIDTGLLVESMAGKQQISKPQNSK